MKIIHSKKIFIQVKNKLAPRANLALKSGLRFLFRHPSSHLLALENGHFCLFSSAKKSKNGDHFLTPTTPQSDGIHVCFVRLLLLGGF